MFQIARAGDYFQTDGFVDVATFYPSSQAIDLVTQHYAYESERSVFDHVHTFMVFVLWSTRTRAEESVPPFPIAAESVYVLWVQW